MLRMKVVFCASQAEQYNYVDCLKNGWKLGVIMLDERVEGVIMLEERVAGVIKDWVNSLTILTA